MIKQLVKNICFSNVLILLTVNLSDMFSFVMAACAKINIAKKLYNEP